jgi:hypothetical protein
VKTKARPTPAFLKARDPERVRTALHAIDGGAPLAELDSALAVALGGSDAAVRDYVLAYRALTDHLLERAGEVRPDLLLVSGDRVLALAHAPVDALVGAAAEAPFGPWTTAYAPGDAVALDLASRVRQLIGLPGLTPPAPRNGARPLADDLDAQRFLRRVRRHLDSTDQQVPLLRVKSAFDLSTRELADLFGVSRQAVDQWAERGVPGDRQEKLGTILAVLDLLERKLKSGRLPGVARRPADAYGGKTMLELIEDDRHRELLDIVRASFDWASAA